MQDVADFVFSLDSNLEYVKSLLNNFYWNSTTSKYYYKHEDKDSVYEITKYYDDLIRIRISDLNFIDELLVRAYLQLINSLLKGYVQFEHISPLINRITAMKSNIKNVLTINNDSKNDNDKILEVVSFRNCNQDVKKILPLIIAKTRYERHKKRISESKTTLHFIIDEAHNILSYESAREEESWKDYRLDLFEEIIKEGRKFGVFMTIASQRPADISHTIISQFHNFFIHRLVNDKDIALIDNAISSLDSVSKKNIPMLPTGACIITGTSFTLPMIIQVDKIIDKPKRPDSDDIDLEKLWNLKKEEDEKNKLENLDSKIASENG